MVLSAAMVGGCRSGVPPIHLAQQKIASVPGEDSPSAVLVVVNRNSADGESLAEYYTQKRHIPLQNIVHIDCTNGEDMTQEDFETLVRDPIKSAITKAHHAIDYIVTTTGVPLRFNSTYGYSVDAGLAAMDLKALPIVTPDKESIRAIQNPYFGSSEHFSHARFGLYLVTRLQASTMPEAKSLVDHALHAKPAKGFFYFQPSESRTQDSYGQLQNSLIRADEYLRRLHFDSKLGPLHEFQSPAELVMGYVSWGSNDNRFDEATQNKLKFRPGAIAETYVSTSARTFVPGAPGQSRISDLIRLGVTGVKGYVSEPYTFALCPADILMARYTSGFNLAESFYASSPVIKWKDLVVGDPLCNPYRKK